MSVKSTIESINKFLETHTFSIPLFDGINDPEYMVDVKIKITGVKNLIRVGTLTEYFTYTIFLEKTHGDLATNTINNFFSKYGSEIKLETNEKNFFISEIRRKTNSLLTGFLEYFISDNPQVIADKIINNIQTKEINESLIIERKYDGITRSVIKDIVKMFKEYKVGEFSLPEELEDSDEMVYDFGRNFPLFSVTLKMIEDDNVEDFEIDGEYYRDDETIVIEIITNPNTDKTILQNLISELNEVVRHELEHVKQNKMGVKMKKEPKKPFDYYNQQKEIDAQIAGFKRRSKQEKKDMEDIIDKWFIKYQKRHNLTPDEVKKIKIRLLSDPS